MLQEWLTENMFALVGFAALFFLFMLIYMAVRSVLVTEPDRAEQRLAGGVPSASRQSPGIRTGTADYYAQGGAGSSVYYTGGSTSGSSIYYPTNAGGERGAPRSRESGGGLRRGMLLGGLTEPLAAQIPQIRVEAEMLETELRRAGFYKPTARVEYLALRNLVVFSILVLTGILAVSFGPDYGKMIGFIVIAGAVLAILAFSVPRFVIRAWGSRRVKEIQFGLPDALDMTAMSVSGGLSLHDALHSVSREIAFSHPALSLELDLVRQQTEMGTLEQALKQFAHRIDAPEVRQMASLVSQSERLGTNVVRALQDHADGIRHMQRTQADERASKVGVKMLFPLVLCMAPAVFIMLWGPAVLEAQNFLDRQRRDGGVLAQDLEQIEQANDLDQPRDPFANPR